MKFYIIFFSIKKYLDQLVLLKEIILDFFIMFAPSVNYLFQVYKFNKTKSSKGFSKYLCLLTILSHTLKVFFWFEETFKYTLLIQSLLVITMNLYLIFLCLKYKEKISNYDIILDEKNNINNNIEAKQFIFDWRNIFNLKLIWKWDNIFEYFIFYFLIVFILTTFHLFFKNSQLYSDFIGFVNIILDTLGSLPQIIEMYRTKDQKNISKIMVLMWFIGNDIKVYYNIYNKSPIQLIIGSYIQAFSNIILIAQIIYYYIFNLDKKNIQTNSADNSNTIDLEDSTENSSNSEEKEV